MTDTASQTAADILFAGSTGGFYTRGISRDIPSDAVVISSETFDALLKAQAKGGRISPGNNGAPVALAPDGSAIDLATVDTVASYLSVPVPSLEQQAQDLFDAASSKMWTDYGCLGESPPEAWTTYLKALRAIATGADRTSTALPAEPAMAAS